MVRSMTPTTSPSLKMGVPNVRLVISRISNSHISSTSHPIYFMFGSRVRFSRSAARMALLPVQSNPGWQPVVILEYYNGIARFLCDSTAFYRAMHFSAKRGIPIACRLSVCLSVTLVDCDHIGWNTSEIISPLVSLGCSLSANPNIMGLLQGEHLGILA